jgi:hypothetical protein
MYHVVMNGASLRRKVVNLIRQMLLVFFMTAIASCSLTLPQREETDRIRKESHIVRLKKCVDSFMSEHGVKIKEAFGICEKIYRR